MIALVLIIAVLLALLSVYSYIDRIYTERGKFLDRRFQQSLDTFEQLIEPQLGSPERTQLCAALWVELSLALVGVLTAVIVLHHPPVPWPDWVEAGLFLILIVIVCNRLVPYVLFTRTRGLWVRRWIPLLRLTAFAMLPVTLALGFALSLASLSEPPPVPVDPEEKRESEIEALVEAGAEEGIIEEHERELVQSALEFGDKRVREVMVPRPDIVALPDTATLADLRELIRERHHSRIPIYHNDIDHIVGIVNTHELLHVEQHDLARESVCSLVHPVMFVPESKSNADLLRDMRRQGEQLAIAVSEYGTVAGLVTLADLVEEIVGEMPENGDSGAQPSWIEEPSGQIVASGSLDLDRLNELLHADLEAREATTVAGYLAEKLGRIPQPGERVEFDHMAFEILDANNVRILRVRITPPQNGRKAPVSASSNVGAGDGPTQPPLAPWGLRPAERSAAERERPV